MPRPISYAVFCLKKKNSLGTPVRRLRHRRLANRDRSDRPATRSPPYQPQTYPYHESLDSLRLVALDPVPARPRHRRVYLLSFFFNVPATTEIYTLSLHDALPILLTLLVILTMPLFLARLTLIPIKAAWRSEERFSRNAETDLVCRLLLEKKKFAWNTCEETSPPTFGQP